MWRYLSTAVKKRVPLIKFLGKRSHVKKPIAPPVDDVVKFGAFFGRPAVTDAEIEAVHSGGATLLN